jgi:lipopolysaccharide export system permease protein
MLYAYLIKLYLRYILIIFTALQLFYVGIDFIGSAPKLPDSANLKLLYVMFMFGTAMKINLPLSLIFALVASKIHLIRANELVVIYALGVSKREVIRPFIWIAALISLAYVAAQATPFAYFDQRALSIKQDKYFVTVTNDVFVKYDNNYIYMERLFPLQKSALGLRIFEIGPEGLQRVITSASAYFINNRWRLYEGEIVTKPKVSGMQPEGLVREGFDTYDLLKGFEPAILDKVYEGKTSYSLSDGLEAIVILSRQDVNIDRIISAMVTTVTIPFFAPLLVVIIFFFVPVSSRFFNIALFSSGAIFTTLVLWGFLIAMSTLAQNGTVNVWLGVMLPFFLLAVLSRIFYRKFS